MLEIRGIWLRHMSRWDRYVLRPRIWMETSRSRTVPHIGPYSRLDPWWAPWLPPFAYISLVTLNPHDVNPFSRSLLCSAVAGLPRSGAPEDLFPTPYRREESPPGASPPPWMLPG